MYYVPSEEVSSELREVDSKEGIKKPVKAVSQEKEKYQCAICGKFLKSKQSHKSHRRRHDNTSQIKCDECGAEVASNFDLRQHQIVHYRKRKYYDCLACDQTFTDWNSMRLHILEAHVKHGESACKHCEHPLKNFWNFLYHAQIELYKVSKTSRKPARNKIQIKRELSDSMPFTASFDLLQRWPLASGPSAMEASFFMKEPPVASISSVPANEPLVSSVTPSSCESCNLIYEDETHKDIHEIFHYHQQVFGNTSK